MNLLLLIFKPRVANADVVIVNLQMEAPATNLKKSKTRVEKHLASHKMIHFPFFFGWMIFGGGLSSSWNFLQN
jgi:hypothetical protein